MTQPIEGLEAAVMAADAARARLAVRLDRPPVRAADAVAPLRRIAEREAAAPSRDRRAVAVVDAAALEADRVAKLVARVIPSGRQWARFDSMELPARVPSESARRASLRACRLPYVVWSGDTGLGKTSLACAALRAWIEAHPKGEPMYVTARKLATARARHPLGEGEPALLVRATIADLLVIDELGPRDDRGGDDVADVIFDREAEGRPTWLTTWLTPDQMATHYGAGIARKVFQRSKVIDCGQGVG